MAIPSCQIHRAQPPRVPTTSAKSVVFSGLCQTGAWRMLCNLARGPTAAEGEGVRSAGQQKMRTVALTSLSTATWAAPLVSQEGRPNCAGMLQWKFPTSSFSLRSVKAIRKDYQMKSLLYFDLWRLAVAGILSIADKPQE
ncbi:hypothetical protein RRG08_054385 [Elysia crispata]|uniref:Uncharacterized protein n=1 Tax=Elysia crispata TaxID=231223 RepID=A0AAE1E9E5_9GAST|nr:hypothetical protein RRG08_054385 [Elysia crispata]